MSTSLIPGHSNKEWGEGYKIKVGPQDGLIISLSGLYIKTQVGPTVSSSVMSLCYDRYAYWIPSSHIRCFQPRCPACKTLDSTGRQIETRPGRDAEVMAGS